MDKQRPRLGNTVVDVSSGFTGIATFRTLSLHGNIRYGVQPKSSDPSKIADVCIIDEQLLDYVDDGCADRCIELPLNVPIALGDEVQDIVTKIKGIAVEREESMGGCVRFVIMTRPKRDAAEAFYSVPMDYTRLEVVGKGVIDKIVAAVAKGHGVKKKDVVLSPISGARVASMPYGQGCPSVRVKRS